MVNTLVLGLTLVGWLGVGTKELVRERQIQPDVLNGFSKLELVAAAGIYNGALPLAIILSCQ